MAIERSATFLHPTTRDVEQETHARAAASEAGTVVTIDLGDGHAQYLRAEPEQALALLEALEFATDTLRAEVPQRNSPAARALLALGDVALSRAGPGAQLTDLVGVVERLAAGLGVAFQPAEGEERGALRRRQLVAVSDLAESVLALSRAVGCNLGKELEERLK